ncbi:MAG: primase alpha helix C-terminal domain-containing protein [Nitrospirae bacterium]|nr:primase alpha helix C-terminal domain-containing protein [Nitrospirota bacterium]
MYDSNTIQQTDSNQSGFLGKSHQMLKYLGDSARLIILQGYSNSNTDYQNAKKALESKWNEINNYSISDNNLSFYHSRGHWFGLIVPAEFIVVDIDDINVGKVVYDGIIRNYINFIAIRTPNGFQFIFKNNELVKTQKTNALTLGGFVCDYRLAQKGYIVLPTSNTENREVVSCNIDNGVSEMPMLFFPVRQVKGTDDSGLLPLPIEEGSRNDTIFKHTCRLFGFNKAHKLGLSESFIAIAIREVNMFLCREPLSVDEVMRCFESAMKNCQNNEKRGYSDNGYIDNSSDFNDYDHLPFCFWTGYVTENGKLQLNIEHRKLIAFLEKEGYRKMRLHKGNNLQKITIHIENNLVEEVDLPTIKNRIFKIYLPKLPDVIGIYASKNGEVVLKAYKSNLHELLLRGIDSYLSPSKIDTLEVVDIECLRDTKNSTFFFFKKGFVEVTKDNVILKKYTELSKPIWRSQLIDFNISIDMNNFYQCNFIRFTENICTRRDIKNPEDKYFDQKRHDSLVTMMGYLLNNYNDPAYLKAVILSDSIIDSNPNGGTGKGILANAIGETRKIAKIDGKNFNFESQFALQELTLDTNIVWFDDVSKGFNFERLFSYITEHYSFEKKNQARINFTPESNPKTIISTNYAIRGEGSSHVRRRFEFELYNYYNADFTPFIEFGEVFFKDWGEQQWNSFYNFMFICVQAFLLNNSKISDYESTTLEHKKLINEIGEEFIEFADSLYRNSNLSKEETYKLFIAKYLSDKQKHSFSNKKFGRYLKKYCDHNNIDLQDKYSNNTHYYYLSTL